MVKPKILDLRENPTNFQKCNPSSKFSIPNIIIIIIVIIMFLSILKM